MPKIEYTYKMFGRAAADMIEHANEIIEEYQHQGFILTLRQLYYQFVSRDLIPNQQKQYKRLGSIISDARLAGLVDWNAIEDRTRSTNHLAHWKRPGEILLACAQQYRRDKWENQEYRPQVWIEKDALVGVIEGVCNELDVPFLSCRGYTSQSQMWNSAMQMRKECDEGYRPIIIHLGDHDPSGIDMTRDIAERIELFVGEEIEVNRIALNIDQVHEHEPPPNPAKSTDSRYQSYTNKHGEESWELDALEPAMISGLIHSTICQLRDVAELKKVNRKEAREKSVILKLAQSLEK